MDGGSGVNMQSVGGCDDIINMKDHLWEYFFKELVFREKKCFPKNLINQA